MDSDGQASVSSELRLSHVDVVGLSFCIVQAAEYGVLSALAGSSHPVSTREIEALSGITEARAEALLHVLHLAGVISVDQTGWLLTPLWAEIEAKSPAGLDGITALWSDLSSFLSGGVGPLAKADSTEVHYRESVLGMRGLYQSRAEALAIALTRHLDTDSGGMVFDIGCGSGVWSASIARQFGFQAMFVDYEQVVRSAVAARPGVPVAADARSLPFRNQSGACAVVANVLHCMDETSAQRVVLETCRMLRVGGLLVVVDSFTAGGPTSIHHALYDLNLRVRGGQLHSSTSVRGMVPPTVEHIASIELDASGFVEAQIFKQCSDLG